MRPPTDEELDVLAHGASSLDVRSRGRLSLLRVGVPADVDPMAVREGLLRRLARTPLHEAEVLVQAGGGEEVCVLGGLFG